MSSLLEDLIGAETLAAVKSRIIGYAAGAELVITDWISGGVGEQLYQAFALTTYTYAQIATRVTRGFASLDTSTDPGDPDTFNPGNEDLQAEPGFLSYFGENTFGTVRGSETFADGFVTFVNEGTQARTFAPDALTFTWTDNSPPSPAPTYRNAADPAIYVNADGTITVAAGATVVLPVVAEEIGTRSNAPASSLSLTTSMVLCSATNAAAILGSDREDAEVFRGRCRQAPSRLSLGGPSAAYAYLAAKNIDGTPLLNANGDEVAITRTYVSESSATGIVNAYYASDAGSAIADDVTAANDNIESECFAVPDAITFTGVAATATSIHVAGTAKIKARVGVTAAAVKTAIVAALTAAFKGFPIGGVDQAAGAGVIYTTDLRAIAAAAYPGLYDALVTTPAGASTAIALGHVATLNSVVGDWTVTVVP